MKNKVYFDDVTSGLTYLNPLFRTVVAGSESDDMFTSMTLRDDSTYIFVAKTGNDTTGTGSIIAPYLTITKAFSVVTSTRKTIYVLPGTYQEATILTWPAVNNVQLIGLDWGGNVAIQFPADAAAEVILINPAFTSATFSAFVENVLIYHDTKIGIKIDNTGMGSRKLMVYLIAMPTYGAGNSVDISHTVVGQAIRLYMANCDEVTGLVNIAAGSTTVDDRFRFRNCTLIGGVTSADAMACEVTLLNSVVLTGGLTTAAANVVTLVGNAYRTSGGVYTLLADVYSTAPWPGAQLIDEVQEAPKRNHHKKKLDEEEANGI